MIEILIENIPPKKHGEKSMWDNPTESKRIVSLRKELFNRIKTPLKGFIKLELNLYVPKNKLESIGDLDNFITGICDALQKSHMRINKFNSLFDKPENKSIHPQKISFIENDSKITSIIANKKLTNKGNIHYKLILTPVQP